MFSSDDSGRSLLEFTGIPRFFNWFLFVLDLSLTEVLSISSKNGRQRWHPDKCSASGNHQRMEEAKEKFQEIQKAYTGLFFLSFPHHLPCSMLLDLSFAGKICINGHDSFEELQRMFLDMFQDDLNAGFGDSPIYSGPQARPTDGLNCSMMPSGPQFADGGSNGSNKRGNSGKANLDGLENSATGFCFGLNDAGQSSKGKGSTNSKRRNGRKQQVSSKHDVSSCDAEVSF
ncbi:hypothetical protein BHM03_00045081 [Ensete ventricosum]|nr:hypothetical protein BHM03_00045081 [Ensete ventricosum]